MHEHTCVVCAGPVEKKSKHGAWPKYCSDKCRKPPKRCRTCGDVLQLRLVGRGVAGPRIYCSETCKPRCKAPDCDRSSYSKAGYCPLHDSQLRRGNPIGPPRWSSEWKCVVCGASVEKGSGRRKHCSNACQVADSRHRRTSSAPRPESFDCRLCGKSVSIKSRSAGGRLPRTDTVWCRDCGRESPDAKRFHRYGITPEEYKEALARGCEICKAHPSDLHIDHDHGCCTGRKRTCGECVRGFLCGPCNRALGMFRDDTGNLLSAIEYLNKSTVDEGLI